MTTSPLIHLKPRFWLVIFLPFTLLWSSCSNTKDTLITRTFHNLSAHYNGYYNAGIKLDEANEKLATASQDHYDRILPVFQYGDAAKAKAVYPQLEDVLKRTKTNIERHTIIDKRGNEKPNSEVWIDDNHLLYGKAQFFKHDYFDAIESFKYVESTYKKDPGHHLGSLWLAKTYIELTQMREAEEKLDYVNNQSDFPKKNKWELAAANADFHLQTKNYDNAIKYLTRAAALVKNRDTKIRWLFILAQLHQQKGEFKFAFDLYTKVIKMNPKYEIGFNARLNRARCSDGTSGNNEMVRKELDKMQQDPKNKDFLDQIYFALAGLAKNEGHPDQQVEFLNKSVRTSTINTTQKALSYLELGKIQFEKKEYRLAQIYYDSTTSLLTNDYPDYTEILNRRNSLTKLVKNMRVIENEDSLQLLASLSPADRQAKIDAVLQKEEEEKQKLKEEQQSNQIFHQSGSQTEINNFNKQSGGGWYFYNPTAVSFGLNEFSKKFGNRKLEDNWRRSNKQSTIIDQDNTQDKEVLSDDSTSTDSSKVTANDGKRKADMLKAIPSDKAALEKSTNKIIDAYYNIGMIYREQLNDLNASAETFEKLLQRFPGNKYMLQAYYQLYRLYATLGNSVKSEYYKNIILRDHANTEYAEIIRNPNYASEKANRKTDLEIFYEETYRKYLNGEYQEVLTRKAQADQQFPKSTLAPQFELLKALAIGKTQSMATFEASLQDIVRNYGDDPVKERAQDILDAIHARSGTPTPIAPVQSGPATTSSLYKYIPDTTHYVVILFQNIGGPIDATKFKVKLSNFNMTNYASKGIDVQDILFDARKKILILKSFNNREEALSYNTALYDNDDVYGNTDPADYEQYVISVNNLPTLIQQRNTTEYTDFYRNFYQ